VELPLLARDAAEIILTTFDSPRARDEGDYFLYMGDYSYNNDYKAALADLVSKFPDDVIVVTGVACLCLRSARICGEGSEIMKARLSVTQKMTFAAMLLVLGVFSTMVFQDDFRSGFWLSSGSP
jgi:hypothetical protein